MAKRRQGPTKTRNAGQWTEARYWSFIRSALRRASVKWPPRNEALRLARRPTKFPDGRRKYDYKCAICERWWKGKEVQVDHIVECGSLNCAEDLIGFVLRLFCEVCGFRVLCKGCHKNETANQRAKKRTGDSG